MKNSVIPLLYPFNEFVSNHVLKEAQIASQSSFGVAGILVNLENHSIIDVFHNEVVSRDSNQEKYRIKDPTAHGERQLVDWYFKHKENLKLPDPKDIVLITSLDPCCMCTGSILSAGFNVIVVSLDDQAGINYDNQNLFSSLDQSLKDQITRTFTYPKVDNDPSRKGFGEIPPIFTQVPLSKSNVEDCSKAFLDGYEKVTEIISHIVPKKDLLDVTSSQTPDWIVSALKEQYPNALTYKLKEHGVPDAGVAPYLIEAALEDKKNGGDGDAVAFFDYFDNLILCKPGMKSLSPIRTAFMETIRTYEKIRYDLSKNSDTVFRYLCDPKYGTFVFFKGFDLGSQSFADMGAYGSTMFGHLDPDSQHNLQYVLPRVPLNILNDHIQKMPPYYVDLLKPKQVTDRDLIDLVCQKFKPLSI